MNLTNIYVTNYERISERKTEQRPKEIGLIVNTKNCVFAVSAYYLLAQNELYCNICEAIFEFTDQQRMIVWVLLLTETQIQYNIQITNIYPWKMTEEDKKKRERQKQAHTRIISHIIQSYHKRDVQCAITSIHVKWAYI